MEVADGRASPDPWFCNEMSNVRYYKGLGTSTPKEAKAGGMRGRGWSRQEYFQEIEQHEVKFQWQGDQVRHSTSLCQAKLYQDGEAIDLAFNKKRADDRKDAPSLSETCRLPMATRCR